MQSIGKQQSIMQFINDAASGSVWMCCLFKKQNRTKRKLIIFILTRRLTMIVKTEIHLTPILDRTICALS